MSVTEIKSFSELNLNSWLVRQCGSIGVKNPTPIQANCIPKILNGKDCIGAAKTGSGKTFAFALPILQKLYEDPYGIFALILTPTRELAFQIAEQFSVIGKPVNLKLCTIVGGMDMVRQGTELSKKPHIVVATPGRLADHLQSCNTFNFSRLQFFVLDEADRLLTDTFEEHLQIIRNALPKKKQSLFFSATITDAVEKLKDITDNEIFLYKTPDETATVEKLDQRYVLCPGYVRDAYFVEVLRKFRSENGNGNIMVFTKTCEQCQVLSMMLNEVGFENVALHSMMSQTQRLATLARFKSNVTKILIATDVASRGLDIPTVQLVVNHILPEVPEDYIHRVGRTARAGRSGMAISLVSPKDTIKLQVIEEFINIQMTEYKVDDKEVSKIFTQVSVTKSEARMNMEENDFFEKRRINKRKQWILEGKDPDTEEKKLAKKAKKQKRPEKKVKGEEKKRVKESKRNRWRKDKKEEK